MKKKQFLCRYCEYGSHASQKLQKRCQRWHQVKKDVGNSTKQYLEISEQNKYSEQIQQLNNKISNIQADLVKQRLISQHFRQQYFKLLDALESKIQIIRKLEQQINQLKSYKSGIFDIRKKIFLQTKCNFFDTETDLDSAQIDIKTSSLRLICSWKATLGATQYRLPGDKKIKDMCLVLTSFPSVFIECKDVQVLRDQLRRRGLIFSNHKSNKAISNKQIIVSTQQVIRCLQAVGIEKVRIIQHGMKAKYFQHYLQHLQILPNPANQLHFAIQIPNQQKIILFQSRQRGSKTFNILSNFCGGVNISHNGNDFKAYNNCWHHIKNKTSFADPQKGVKAKRVKQSVESLIQLFSDFKQDDSLIFSTRFEVSMFNETNLLSAYQELLWFINYVQQSCWNFHISNKNYIQNFFKTIEKKRHILQTRDNKLLSLKQMEAYSCILRMAGIHNRFSNRILKTEKFNFLPNHLTLPQNYIPKQMKKTKRIKKSQKYPHRRYQGNQSHPEEQFHQEKFHVGRFN